MRTEIRSDAPKTTADGERRPYGWQDWSRYERSFPGGKRFVRWAEPAPDDVRASRYAVAEDDHLPLGSCGRVVWFEVSASPNVSPRQSGGCFYAETAEEAYALAELNARLHRAKVAALVSND